MISIQSIIDIVLSSIINTVETDEKPDQSSFFIGPKSVYSSLQIVQIIALIEDELDTLGFDDYDLFDKLLSHSELSIATLCELIYSDLCK